MRSAPRSRQLLRLKADSHPPDLHKAVRSVATLSSTLGSCECQRVDLKSEKRRSYERERVDVIRIFSLHSLALAATSRFRGRAARAEIVELPAQHLSSLFPASWGNELVSILFAQRHMSNHPPNFATSRACRAQSGLLLMRGLAEPRTTPTFLLAPSSMLRLLEQLRRASGGNEEVGA